MDDRRVSSVSDRKHASYRVKTRVSVGLPETVEEIDGSPLLPTGRYRGVSRPIVKRPLNAGDENVFTTSARRVSKKDNNRVK